METDFNTRLKQEQQKEQVKEIRRFGFSFSAGMLILFGISLWHDFLLPLKILIITLCLYHLLCAFLNYKMLLPTYHVLNFIGKIVGNFIVMILFTIVFYIFFTPIAIILRWANKDHIKNISQTPQWHDIPEKYNNSKRIEKAF